MAKTTAKKAPQSRTVSLTRNGETFTFDNPGNLPADQFSMQCEREMDKHFAARDRYNKYKALGAELVKQKTSGEISSDYDQRLADVINFETENPAYSQGYGAQLTKKNK